MFISQQLAITWQDKKNKEVSELAYIIYVILEK